MQRAREELWREDEPSYNRTWDESIVDTPRWTIGTRSQRSPLKQGLGD